FEGEQQLHQVSRRILRGLLHDSSQGIGHGRAKPDSLDHESGQIHAHTLIRLKHTTLSSVQEGPTLELLERLPKLLLRIHHDRPIPGYRLLDWFSRNEEEPDSVVAGLHLHLIAPVEEYERTIVCLRRRRGIQPPDPFSRHGKRTGCIAEL